MKKINVDKGNNMEFVRTIIDSDELKNIVSLPETLKHRQVELLILPIEKEEIVNNDDFDPDSYSGILHLSEDDLKNSLKAIPRT